MDEKLLKPAEVAEILDIPLQTLYSWRRKRQGPPAARMGRHLRYRQPDVRAWIDQQFSAE